jgi:hypothetical protein
MCEYRNERIYQRVEAKLSHQEVYYELVDTLMVDNTIAQLLEMYNKSNDENEKRMISDALDKKRKKYLHNYNTGNTKNNDVYPDYGNAMFDE